MLLVMRRNIVPLTRSLWKYSSSVLWAHSYSAQTGKNKNEQRKLLKKLRETTGYPILKCKNALDKFNFDFPAAEKFMKEEAIKEGWDKMKLLKNRPTKQGLVTVIGNNKNVAMIEVNCETDFVGKTDSFHNLVFEAVKTVHKNVKTDSISKTLSSDEILSLPTTQNIKVNDLLAKTIAHLKENIVITRAKLINLDQNDNQVVGFYVHPSNAGPLIDSVLPTMGRYAAMAILKAEEQVGKHMLRDIAQHIVGMKPTLIGTPPGVESSNDAAKEVSKTQEDVFKETTEEEENAEDAKLESDFTSSLNISAELLKQPFLLNTDLTVHDWLQFKGLEVIDFERFEVGETASNDD